MAKESITLTTWPSRELVNRGLDELEAHILDMPAGDRSMAIGRLERILRMATANRIADGVRLERICRQTVPEMDWDCLSEIKAWLHGVVALKCTRYEEMNGDKMIWGVYTELSIELLHELTEEPQRAERLAYALAENAQLIAEGAIPPYAHIRMHEDGRIGVSVFDHGAPGIDFERPIRFTDYGE